MASLPGANVTIDAEAGPLAGGTGYCVIFGCAAQNADTTPRVFSSAKALLAQHGYSQAASYAATHISETRKPVIFVGLPIVTAGTIGRYDASGVTGTSVISVAAGANGVLEEVDAILTVTTGGTIGTNGIAFDLSLDGGVTNKPIRLGTATSYTVPYVGLVISFAAGTLVAGDVYRFATTAPLWDNSGIAAARTALAQQQKTSRSWLIVGDISNATQAGYITTAVNAYETANQRFTVARVNVRDRLPQAAMSRVRKVMTGSPTLTFAEVGGTGDTITRSTGSFISDGFAVGDVITVAGSVSNNITGPIASLTATVITLGTTDLVAEGPVSSCTLVGSPGLTFAEVGATLDTITRSSGSWLADGFRVGDIVTFSGTSSNNVTGTISAVTATVMTFTTTDLAAEVIGSYDVTCTAGETMAAWVSACDTAFASVDAQKRIDIGLGRLRKLCPITEWEFRRPVAWAASVREYQHDVHITTWRKEFGPLDGWTMTDADGTIVEYDERTDGGGLAARFTCARTWSNGPNGAFIAMSLTRDTEGSVLAMTHNMHVANVACGIVQSATENFIGKTPVVDGDGHMIASERSKLELSVNTDLAIALRQEQVIGEGPRASKAVWTASEDDVITGASGTVNGVCELNINGTIVNVNTVVKVS